MYVRGSLCTLPLILRRTERENIINVYAGFFMGGTPYFEKNSVR